MNNQKTMTLHEVVKGLIGDINPVGESEVDDERFENLKEHIDLVENLIMDLEAVAKLSKLNKEHTEHSKRRAADFANNYLKGRVRI